MFQIRLQKRPEGRAQYVHIKQLAANDERFAAMLSNPWFEVPERSPKTDAVEVAIIGAGYGGLCAGARLVMEGIPSSSIRLVDSASDVGGTWCVRMCVVSHTDSRLSVCQVLESLSWRNV